MILLPRFSLVSVFVIQLCQQPTGATPDQHPLLSSSTFSGQPNFDFTSSAPHILTSLRYLLEQWPNTFIPNGHSIVPCEIPAFTTLYHGRRDEKLPSSPEWFAFDAEMSFGIMGSNRNSHLLTYQNVKPVQCLYFDGMSAALMGTGSLDSQMVFLCGNTTCSFGNDDEPWHGIFDEYSRATALCSWIQQHNLGGLGWGVEGIVRMNAGFEMIWCNFTSPSIQMTSHINVSVPLLPEGSRDTDGALIDEILGGKLASQADLVSTSTSSSSPEIPTGQPDMPPPPNWRRRSELEPFLQSQSFEWYRSATWHTGSTGSSVGRADGRVKLNLCGFLSYYDPALKDSSAAFADGERSRLNLTSDGSWKGPGEGDGNLTLAIRELSTRRRSHRLSQITPFESFLMSQAVLHTLQTLNHSSSLCTGIDWTQKTVDVISRFFRPLAQTLELLTHPPAIASNATLTRTYIASLRSKSHAMLMPFLTYPLTASALPAIHARCTTSQTSGLHHDHQLRASILPTEKTIVTAIESVLSEICNTTLSLAFSVEEIWQSHYQSPSPSSRPVPHLPHSTLSDLVTRHGRSFSLLRAWLGWFPGEMQCSRVCAVDEFCFIPIWPLLFLEPRGDSRGPRPSSGHDEHMRPPGKDRPPPRGHNPWESWERELWEPQCIKVLD